MDTLVCTTRALYISSDVGLLINVVPGVSKRSRQFLVSKAICEIVFMANGGHTSTSSGAMRDPYLAMNNLRAVSERSTTERRYIDHIVLDTGKSLAKLVLWTTRNRCDDDRWHKHRRSQGCSGCTCNPLGGENFFSGVIYREMCKCTPRTRSAPPSESKSQSLGQFLLGGLDLEVYLDGLWGRRLKKGRQLFWQKSAPQTKSWLRLWTQEPYNDGGQSQRAPDMSAVPKFMNDKKIEHFWTAITADNSRREIQKKSKEILF